MASSSPNVTALFSDLHRQGQSGDYEKALKLANKILLEEKGNAKAFHCKVVSLIKLGTFDEALDAIEKAEPVAKKDLAFEQAYCQYRLNKVNEALETLEDIKDRDFRVEELMAQTLYRLERYQECYDLYLKLIKNSEDEYEDERETNLAAVVACLSLDPNVKSSDNFPNLGDQAFELCYNKACVELGLTKYEEALQKLTTAEDLCRKTLKEEDATEEEIEAELGIIKAQMGFVYQMMGRDEIALKLYNQVLKQKPDDPALISVTSNNIVTINKDQNVFDSKKKMKAALNENLDLKLSSLQRKTIAINNCLLLMHTNQSEACRKQLQDFKAKFPEATSETVLLKAALLCREKKVNDAVQVLKNFKGASADSLEPAFTLAQLLISQGHVNEACNVLKSLNAVGTKLGMISALISLYLSLEDKDSVVNTLNEAIKWYKKNKPQSPDLLTLYRENARFLVQFGKTRDAITLLEELRKANPTNPKVIAQLISAYSGVDPKKANEIMKDLPSIESEIASVDVDTLEESNWSLGAKYVKKVVKAEASPAVGLSEKKKKRKKKKILPKNYDPNVDPDSERWLPKWQRTAFKKKKDKRGVQSVGKGTQGAVGPDPTEVATKPSPKPGSSNQPTTPQEGPRQQKPGGGKSKSRKKGKR